MKSRVLFLLALLAGSVNILAQNLVPNGSFEEGSECPMFLDDLHFRCNNWYKSIQESGVPMNENPSPDWYHACTTNENVSTPNFVLGWQIPLEGDGFGAFAAFGSSDYREILGVQLNEPLSVGTTYTIKFNIVAETEELPTGLASNKIGFKFSTDPIFFNLEDAVNNFAHGYIESIITDTTNWSEFSFEYTAEEAFAYLHFGNFFDNLNCDTIDVTNLDATNAYYLIDNISVTSSTLSPETILKSAEVVVYPNPANSNLNILFKNSNFKCNTYSIYDSNGRNIIRYQDFINSIDVSELNPGLYFLYFILDNGNQSIIKFSKI